MSCDWKGNRRSGVALAMRHRLEWFIHLRVQGLSNGDEHPTNTVLFTFFSRDNLGKPAPERSKPFWILKDMMGWRWHPLDHMQIICTLPQTDNHASTSSLHFLQAGCSSWRPTNNIKALKANKSTECITRHLCVEKSLWRLKNAAKNSYTRHFLYVSLRGH